ncbi:MAG: imidazole glycerol phosphate synthase subunit HisH [Nitrospirae bacterium]|nr:MAG: imidazole glycerol phosphate synthase subunit HisH [Nitrospirota bacterium]
MIAIVDYGMGNLKSVEKGFHKVSCQALVTSDPKVIDSASGIVVPGVGAFRDCIGHLKELGLVDVIYRSIEKGKPYLGICLGLQLLFTQSEEFGLYEGLDIVKGRVKRFPDMGLKIPHMGWNRVHLVKTPPVFEGIENDSYFYFVHSYYVEPEDKALVAATTDYGIEFTSMLWKDNIIAMQFHPEKSQRLGLKVLENFGRLCKG